MKKLINDPNRYVDEALEGLCDAFAGYARVGASRRVIARAGGAQKGRVGVVSGGGFGHLPLFAGYVGDGLLSACAVGNVFAGPPAEVCGEAIRAGNGGKGVLCVLGNYGGDRMSFQMACDDVEDDDIETATVIVADDVASAAPAERGKRRGVAGLLFSYKAAGAAAAQGASLQDAAAAAQHAADRTRSIGVALSPCLIPGASAPGFEVPEGSIELGMGIHGEPGLERRPLPSADAVTEAMVQRLLADPVDGAGKRVALLVNSLGATPLEELLIVHRKAQALLQANGLEVRRRYVGHYATSMEMAGCSLSLLYLDDALERALDAPTSCPFWPR
jgi:dihydroxyacetone kinase-like protein